MASLLEVETGVGASSVAFEATLSACKWKVAACTFELKYRLDRNSIAASYRAICNAAEDGLLAIAM
jgi:hypothetical protein